jgi:hypothetical protein
VEGDVGEVWKVLRNDPKFELVVSEYGRVIKKLDLELDVSEIGKY